MASPDKDRGSSETHEWFLLGEGGGEEEVMLGPEAGPPPAAASPPQPPAAAPAQASPADAPAVLPCPQCGAQNKPQARFCRTCGAALGAPAAPAPVPAPPAPVAAVPVQPQPAPPAPAPFAAPPPAPAPPPPAPEPPAPAPVPASSSCPQCGTPAAAGKKFCQVCGQALGAAPVPPEPVLWGETPAPPQEASQPGGDSGTSELWLEPGEPASPPPPPPPAVVPPLPPPPAPAQWAPEPPRQPVEETGPTVPSWLEGGGAPAPPPPSPPRVEFEPPPPPPAPAAPAPGVRRAEAQASRTGDGGVSPTDTAALLVIVETPQRVRRGQMIPLRVANTKIGRGRGVGCLLDDPQVDDFHAVLNYERRPEGLAFYLYPVSAKGLVVNGRAAGQITRLHSGDRIRLGGTELVFFQAELKEETA